MLRPFLLSLLFLFFAQTAPAQCTKKAAELPAAPELYGFRLGMTKEQIKAVVPQTHFGHTDDFGVAKTTINPHFDATIDQTKYEGVRSISLDLLDEKLTSIWIGFEETYKVATEAEFVKFISQALQLPASWSSYRSRGQQLRCADFQLVVTTVARGPSFRLIDAGAEDTIAARRQAKEEQDAAAEAAGEAENGESGEPVVEIMADKQSKTYYPNGCQPTKQISENNKVTFKTTADAEKAGFKPAKNCRQAIAN
jgi:hypothetical protein